jgi:hypothetical protein
MATLEFPESLMRENSVEWDIAGRVISGGGQTSDFDAQPLAATSAGGHWEAKLSNIPLISADHVRTWRALEAILDNGATPIVVPMCDRRYMPAPLVGGVPLYSEPGRPHAQAAKLFASGVGYYAPVVIASLESAAILRATSLTIALDVGSALRGGEHFSIEHATLGWRLYRVGQVVNNGDDTYDVTIRPPLREATAAGQRVEFDRPRCVMRLAKPGAMSLMLTMRRHGTPSVSFTETFSQ